MRFKSIELKNMRHIGDEGFRMEVDDNKNVLILLGDNGTGKSTILDAIATAAAPFMAQFPNIPDIMFKDSDVHISANGRTAPFLRMDCNFTRRDNGNDMLSLRFRKGLENGGNADTRQLKDYANSIKESLIAGNNDVVLPVLAYYGTGRGRIEAPERKRAFQKTFERWDCYKSALTPAADFKTFFAWFDLMEDEERRKREELRDFDYKSPVLEAVRVALSSVLNNKFTRPRIELHPLRFVMDEVTQDEESRQLRIEQMSDGYKIVIAMVADIAARMAEANPMSNNILNSPGIVLIDEIDLHLHPKWQRRIIGQLTTTFPNIQFIVSTHSPIIVVGAGENAQVIKLGNENGYCDILSDNKNISQILLGNLFKLESLYGPQWDEDIKERDRLLSKAERTEEEENKLSRLNDKLSVLTFESDPESIKSNMLIKKIAEAMNISL